VRKPSSNRGARTRHERAGLGRASGPVDLYNAGPGAESVQTGGGVNLGDPKRGAVYRASTFPLNITVRPPDGLWLGGHVRKGTHLRIVVVAVRGKTAVIWIQPSLDRQDRTFPAFVRSADRLLSAMTFRPR
jgi:hypothetical protein